MGAWIETQKHAAESACYDTVAPRVGAWIETAVARQDAAAGLSHPVWVRGLKLTVNKKTMYLVIVAPRVGAWIETIVPHAYYGTGTSHPVWVRGLKLFDRGEGL